MFRIIKGVNQMGEIHLVGIIKGVCQMNFGSKNLLWTIFALYLVMSYVVMTPLNYDITKYVGKFLLKAQFALKCGDVMTSLNLWAKSLLKAQFPLKLGDVMTSLNLWANFYSRHSLHSILVMS